MSAPSPWTIRAARALAVLLPVGLLVAAFAELGAGRSEDAQREFDNAGQLLNGEVLETSVNDAIAARMANAPEVVVIGNSFANTNVTVPMLARALGFEPRQATRLSIPNTVGAHWYALLAHRVFAPDRRPPAYVVLIADLQSALLTTPLSEGSHANLLALMDGPDPVIDARVERVSSFWWTNVLERRERLRRDALVAVRNLSVRPILRKLPEARRNQAVVEHMDRVFHPQRMDPALERPALPVTVDAEGAMFALDALPRPEDSFLPEIARVCAEHGTRLIVVRNVASPAMPADQGDRVPPGTEDRIRALLEARGAVLIEMERLTRVADQYANLDHMTEEGSRRFTRALTEALTDLGAAEAPHAVLAPPRVDAIGRPVGEVGEGAAALASMRRSWTAIPAGGTAGWQVAPWVGGPGTFRVRAVIEPVGQGTPTLSIAGEAVPLERLPSGRWIGEQAGEPPAGAFTIEVGAGPTPVVVQGLEVGTGWTPRYAVGYRPDVRGHRLELLGRAEVFGGEVYFDAVRPEPAGAPPPVPRQGVRFTGGPGLAAGIEAPRLAFLSDLEVRGATPRNARCSPLRVFEDGVALPTHNVGCKEVRDLGLGRVCHVEQRLFYAATDLTDPQRNGREYTLGLDPERRCDGGVWLYPGDTIGLTVPPERLLELRDGVERVRVVAAGIAGDEGPRTVELHVDGEVVGRHELPGDEPLEITLEEPLPPTSAVRLVVQHAGTGFALLTSVELLPPTIPWDQR